MKKIALGVLVLILAGALVAPKLVGDKAHQAYLKSFAEYPTGSSGLSFEHRSYEQSWFTSKAVSVMNIPLGDPDQTSISLVLTSDVAHGPVMYTKAGLAFGLGHVKSEMTFEDLPVEIQELVDEYLPAGTITMASLIGFDQVSSDEMHIESISLQSDQVKAVFGGLNSSGVSKLDYSLMKGDIELPASHITADDFAVDAADASGSYDMYKYRSLMMLGKAELNYPQIKIVAPQGTVTLEDFRIASNYEEQSGNLNMATSMGVRNIIAPVPVTAFQYDMQMNQVDARAFELWVEITQEMQVQPADPAAALNNPKMRELVELLVQSGMELNQQITLDGMGGRLSIDWDTRFVGLPNGATFDDMMQLLKAVDIHVVVTVDEQVVMASPLAAMATPYMQQGLIVKQGDKLVSDMTLTDGVMTVNGIEIPVGGLVGS